MEEWIKLSPILRARYGRDLIPCELDGKYRDGNNNLWYCGKDCLTGERIRVRNYEVTWNQSNYSIMTNGNIGAW